MELHPGWLVLLVTIVVTLVIVTIYMTTRSTSSESKLGGPPPPPSQLAATNLTSSSVTLNWQSNVSAAGYDVQYQVSGSKVWVDFKTVTGNTAVVTGLDPATIYNFSVAAVNNYGVSTAVILTGTQLPNNNGVGGNPGLNGGTPPSAPTNVVVSSVMSTSVTLSWQGDDSAIQYQVAYQISQPTATPDPNDSMVVFSLTPQQTMIVAGLVPHVTYDFSVLAVNNYGISPAVTVQNIQLPLPPPAGGGFTPDIVTGLTSSNVTSTSVDLAWSAPTPTASKSPALRYNISYQISGSSSWVIYSTTDQTSLTVGGLVPSTTYNFGITSINNYGTSTLASLNNLQTTSLGLSGQPPSVPLNLKATTVTSNSVTLNWNPPTTSPAVQYNVLYQVVGSPSTSDGWLDYGITSSTTVIVTGLSSYISYNFQVIGINNYGGSQAASLNNIAIPAPPPPTGGDASPSTPTHIQVVSNSNGAVTINWDPMTSAAKYQVQYGLTGTGNGWFIYGTTSSTTLTITGLAPGAQYNFGVSAINNYGSSSVGMVTGYQLPAMSNVGLPPGSPSGLKSSSLNSTSVTLTWTAPDLSSGNGATIEYEVLYQVTGSPVSLWIEYGVTPYTSIAITGLSTYTSYNFQVSGINNYGTGTAAILNNIAVVGSIATGNAPSAPSGLTVNSTTSSTATLSWTAATGANQYSLSYQVSGSSSWVNFGTTTSPTLNVTGLSTNVGYNFNLVGINNFGVGSPAQINNVLISQQLNTIPAPSMPVSLQTTAVTDTSVSLSWLAPAVTANNGPAVQYNLSYQVVGSANIPSGWVELGSVTALFANVTGLIANAAYNFQVTAINNSGVSVPAVLSSILLPGYPLTGIAPSIPTGLKVTQTLIGSLSFGWTNDAGSNVWNVAYQLSGSSSNSWVEAGSTSTNNYTITNLVGYMTYNIGLVAVNNYGASPTAYLNNITVPGVIISGNPPSYPTALQGVSTSPYSVTLTWTAPSASTGVGTPAQYNVGYQINGSSPTSWISWGSVVNATATITGLTSYLSYNFQVTAANNSGTSVASTCSNVNILGPTVQGTPPGSPTNLQVGSSTPNSVTLNWGVPSMGGAVAQYDVTYQLSGSGSWINCGSVTGLSMVIPNLTSTAVYNFNVAAINNYGSSSLSSLVGIVVPSTPGNPPGTPTNIQSTVQNQSVALTWSAPNVGVGAGAAVEYNVEYQIAGTGSSWFDFGTTMTPSASVTGLVTYTTYNFRITAINNYGSGISGVLSNILIPGPTTPTAPGPPTNLNTTTVTYNSVGLSWTAPSLTSGGAVAQYNVMYQVVGSASDSTGWIDWNNMSTTTTTVTGLTSYLSYNFKVSAVNNGGSSAPVLLNNILVGGASAVGTAPSSPSTLTVSSTTLTSSTLQWTAASTGSSASQYLVQYQTSGSGSDPTAWINFIAVTGLTATVTGLTSYASYNFSVIAINNYGSSTPATLNNIPVPSSGGNGNVPSTPTGFVMGANSTGWASNIQGFQWNVPNDITQYIFSYQLSGSSLWYDISVGAGLYQLNGSTKVATFLVDSLSPGNKYNFQLSAVNNSGTSNPAIISGMTLLPAPMDLTVVENNGNAMATWNPISNPPANTQYKLVYGLNGTDASTWTSTLTTNTSLSLPISGKINIGLNTFFVIAVVIGDPTYLGFNDTRNDITIT